MTADFISCLLFLAVIAAALVLIVLVFTEP